MFGKDKKQKKEERFYIKETQYLDFLGGVHILVDKITGVNYLAGLETNGITPLLDENGKPIIDKPEEKEREIW